MNDLRISRLILNLNIEELELIQKTFVNNKQKFYSSILDAILALKEKDLTREDIYLRVYKKKYTANNDGIFRNHLSDMADVVEEIIIDNSLQNKSNNSPEYLIEQLAFYQRLQLHKECENILKKIKEYTLQYYNYHFYLDALDSYAQYIHKVFISFEDRFEKLKFVNEQVVEFQNLQHDIDIAKRQHSKGLMFHATIHNSISIQLDKNTLDEFDKNIQNAVSPIGKYWNLAGICILLSLGTFDTLYYFDELLTIAKDIYNSNSEFIEQYYITLSMIAFKYRNMGEFEKSNTYYEEMFLYMSKVKKPDTQTVFVQYISNLIKLKKYEDALQRISFIESAFSFKAKGNQVQIAIVKMMCYTYLENPKELHKIIVENEYTSLSNPERIYFRQSLCNAYLMEGDYETAEMESIKLYRSKLVKEIDADLLSLGKLMQSIILQVCKNQQMKLTPEQLETIRKAQLNVDFERFPVLKHYTPYLWLTEKFGI